MITSIHPILPNKNEPSLVAILSAENPPPDAWSSFWRGVGGLAGRRTAEKPGSSPGFFVTGNVESGSWRG